MELLHSVCFDQYKPLIVYLTFGRIVLFFVLFFCFVLFLTCHSNCLN